MEEEVMSEVALKVEVLMEMYQAMDRACTDLKDKSNYDKHYGMYRRKQSEMRDKI